MERFVKADASIRSIFDQGKADWVLSPNANEVGSKDASRSTSHGGFDDDDATLRATLVRIAGKPAGAEKLIMNKSAALLRGRRMGIELQTDMQLPASGQSRRVMV